MPMAGPGGRGSLPMWLAGPVDGSLYMGEGTGEKTCRTGRVGRVIGRGCWS